LATIDEPLEELREHKAWNWLKNHKKSIGKAALTAAGIAVMAEM